MNTEALLRHFERAGLRAEISPVPLNPRRDTRLFQIGVKRKKGSEWVVIWPGSGDDRVSVTSSDATRCEITLRVYPDDYYHIGLDNKTIFLVRTRHPIHTAQMHHAVHEW